MNKWIVLGGILNLLFCVNLFAQETTKPSISLDKVDYDNRKKYLIEDITVTGINFFSPEQVISISGLIKGDMIDIPGETTKQAVKRLWMQRSFGNVDLTITKIEGDKVWLNIDLQERPRIYNWEITGIRKGQRKDLQDNLGLRRNGAYSDYAVKNAVDKIKKFFADKGYLNTTVEVTQTTDTSNYFKNSVKLTFHVDKKSKVKIKKITFDGNEELKSRKLQASMKKTKQKSLRNFFKSKKYIEENFEEDKDNLINYFNEKGFRDAEILEDSVYKINDKQVGIYIKVKEGKRYYFRNISWIGNTKISSDNLSRMLKIDKGDVYDQVTLNKMLLNDEQSINTWYQDEGYLFSRVTPVETNIDNDSIDLEVRIFEGDQARFNRIDIIGNTKTNEHVARRELYTVPGDLFGITKLRESIRNLANLGYFDAEKLYTSFPKIQPNEIDGTVDITYAVEEKANDQLEISGGWGANMFVGTLGIRFTNFSIRRFFDFKSWRPVPSGDGQTLSVRAQTNGKRYQQYSISFMEPWVGGKKPVSLSISAYFSNQTSAYYYDPYGYYGNMNTTGESMKVMGLSVGLGYRLKWPDHMFSLYYELNLQRYMLNNWRGNFIFEDGNSNDLSLKIVFGRKSIDQPIFTRVGSDFSIGVQFTPPYSLFSNKHWKEVKEEERYKWIEYHKWTFNGAVYTPIVGNLILHARGQFGYLGYYNKDWGYSPFGGFVVGGGGMSGYVMYGQDIIALRGYEDNSLTPLAGKAYAGNVYNKITAEVRFPIILQPQSTIYVLGFLEAGNAWSDIKQFNPFSLKRSAGFGVRIFLPIVGMLGLDWGYGFDTIPGRPGANGGNLAFVLGQQF
ncbi:MAG: outer membrane protein assembly factor BamA [Prevotellaceae bacterium]|jgi:outer membrane protein insertion porin family|nr:outer membrane protein assembly factor BamA [Prevotellaceae bacterium]